MQGEHSAVFQQLIDDRIAEYFLREENLHWLRSAILNLEGYRRQSDIDEEIKALKDEQSRDMAALQTACDERIEKLEKEKTDALSEMQAQHSKELREAQTALEKYRKTVETKLKAADAVKNELFRWRKDYGELSEAYKVFSALAPRHREAVAGIFGGADAPLDFFCGALQKGHLEQLWDYVGDELGQEAIDEEEAGRLSRLFDFSFAAVNRSQREPLFQRLAVSAGAMFDGDVMGRTAISTQLGTVATVVFAGFSHAVTGRVVRRSLVKLR